MSLDHLHTPEARAKARANRKASPSLRAAINAMCKSCLYESGAGGGSWRQQIEACTATHCPLYEVRPVSSGEKK